MQLKRLSLYNFMPYHKEHEISFPTDLPSRNVMLIFGDNMRGKTSFLNAIRWGFFGKAIGRHLKRIDRVNLVNRDAAKSGDWETRIRIEFLSEGDEYDLRRVMKPKHLVAIPQSNDDFEIELSLSKNNRALSYEEAIYEINQIIPEQTLYNVVAILRDDDSEPVWKTVEKLAEWGVDELSKLSQQGDISFSEIFDKFENK